MKKKVSRVASEEQGKRGAAAVVMKGATVAGSVQLGRGTVVFTGARLVAADECHITVGADNVVEEGAALRCCPATEGNMAVGDGNVFECGCVVEAETVGSGNVFGCRCRVPRFARIGSGCVVGPGVFLPDGAVLLDGQVAYADGCGLVAFKDTGLASPTAAITLAIKRATAYAAHACDAIERAGSAPATAAVQPATPSRSATRFLPLSKSFSSPKTTTKATTAMATSSTTAAVTTPMKKSK
jgi:carbonic anhydrase/acetyltransferase-like protein (isoleucine patch superfamily)